MGIVHTELTRLLRTNRVEQDFLTQVRFFIDKLREKGYDILAIRAIVEKYPFSSKKAILMKKMQNKPFLIPFRIEYSDISSKLGIGGILNQFKNVLPAPIRDKFKFVTSYSVGRSMFRLRYARFC